MARASTPLDPLEPLMGLEADNSIPVNNQPWFSVGQFVQGVIWEHSSFYLKKLLKKSGKVITRQILDFLKRGKQLEYSIAGIEANYALPTISVSNQCYLQNGQCHSGLFWQYKVLIKGVLDGKNVCVIPNVWIGEQDFIPLFELKFQAREFYRDSRNHVYKCVFQRSEPAFVYVGHVKDDGSLRWDNHISPRRLTPWQRRNFQPYTLPDKILYS
ncbi:hypothetical protein ACQ4M3_35275 [Leptolyngbya sp. AN03gr2]|uniref:hypothetical protein n=1 Tax=unclassified Leptolyngbya TaxID=2650499 RepID=UPI003D3153BA